MEQNNEASLDNSGNLTCKNCGEKIKICTELDCDIKNCGKEWVHVKTKKHECEKPYIIKPKDKVVMDGKTLSDFKHIVVSETLDIKPEQLFTGKVVKSGNGASISFKKKFIGKEVYIIVKE
jgi:putative transposon-encoded protein